jgi:integrase
MICECVAGQRAGRRAKLDSERTLEKKSWRRPCFFEKASASTPVRHDPRPRQPRSVRYDRDRLPRWCAQVDLGSSAGLQLGPPEHYRTPNFRHSESQTTAINSHPLMYMCIKPFSRPAGRARLQSLRGCFRALIAGACALGTRWFTGGVSVAPRGRIMFDFTIDGVRYRPTIRRPCSEANLRRARERLESIRQQIALGTFSFAEEFPDYRYIGRVVGSARVRSCDQVFNEFLTHCESRLSRNDLATATLNSYRRVLDSVWRPALGELLFHKIRYSHLAKISDRRDWSKKTYNNAVSIVRRAFEFGYRDLPEQHNPALSLRTVRLKKKDRPKIDPFNIQDAETLIAAIHRDWGEAQGNYDEFRFFTGMRPSEQIALVLSDTHIEDGAVSVNKACVAGVDRDCTKTGEDRRMFLCPRALEVLRSQLQLRARLEGAGQIDHDYVFFHPSGEPIRLLNGPYERWRHTLRTSIKLRYRKPYCARHSSVSWNLMIGKNPLWVSKQHGHSVTTMLRVYTAWADGASEADIKAIKRAMKCRPARLLDALRSQGDGTAVDGHSTTDTTVARGP